MLHESLKSSRRCSTHLALYGNVGLIRAKCGRCGDLSIVLDGCTTCCGAAVEEAPDAWQRIIEPEFERRQPSAAEKLFILSIQENKCLYCDERFGSFVWRKAKRVRLKIHWDHFVPFAYNANNSGANFVAACHICNGIKKDKIFDSVEEARVHIVALREVSEAVDLMPPLQEPVPAEPEKPKILLAKVPERRVDRKSPPPKPVPPLREPTVTKPPDECAHCHKPFFRRRKNQVYCAPVCKTSAWRERTDGRGFMSWLRRLFR